MKKIWSVPGKVFLLGEYAVLSGAKALVGAISPRFLFSHESFEWAGEFSERLSFHHESPAGKVLAFHAAADRSLYGIDPWRGAGGFGASTAQVLFLEKLSGNLLELHSPEFRKAWERYRELGSRPGELAPSGADFVTQALGGLIGFDPEEFLAKQLGETLYDQRATLQIRVIQASRQAGRKVATHEHLKILSKRGEKFLSELARSLSPITESGLEALIARDALSFAQALSLYGDTLASFELEDGATQLDRRILAEVPGVLGVKGTGALQADALVAAINPSEWDQTKWRQALDKRQLIDVGIITGLEKGAE